MEQAPPAPALLTAPGSEEAAAPAPAHCVHAGVGAYLSLFASYEPELQHQYQAKTHAKPSSSISALIMTLALVTTKPLSVDRAGCTEPT